MGCCVGLTRLALKTIDTNISRTSMAEFLVENLCLGPEMQPQKAGCITH